ncbi:MAG: hypothetical protein FWG63_08645 [Defluviitaleaceae bacterium]|nr:hypothetical protein [Defluviitaleaceae bacterium]
MFWPFKTKKGDKSAALIEQLKAVTFDNKYIQQRDLIVGLLSKPKENAKDTSAIDVLIEKEIAEIKAELLQKRKKSQELVLKHIENLVMSRQYEGIDYYEKFIEAENDWHEDQKTLNKLKFDREQAISAGKPDFFVENLTEAIEELEKVIIEKEAYGLLNRLKGVMPDDEEREGRLVRIGSQDEENKASSAKAKQDRERYISGTGLHKNKNEASNPQKTTYQTQINTLDKKIENLENPES